MCNIDVDHRKQTQVNYAEIKCIITTGDEQRYKQFCIAHNSHIPQISGVWKWHCENIKQIYDVLYCPDVEI